LRAKRSNLAEEIASARDVRRAMTVPLKLNHVAGIKRLIDNFLGAGLRQIRIGWETMGPEYKTISARMQTIGVKQVNRRVHLFYGTLIAPDFVDQRDHFLTCQLADGRL
jgi:hypothetical protein